MSAIIRQVRVQVAEPGATDFSGTLTTFVSELALSGDTVITLTPRVLPLEGRTESRPIAFPVLDIGNVITSTLGDADGHMQWLGRLARLQVLDTTDGVAGSWTSKATGRVSRLAMLEGPGKWLIELSDERWIERAHTAWTTDATLTLPDGSTVDVGGTTLGYPGGILYPWAESSTAHLPVQDYLVFEVSDTSPLTLQEARSLGQVPRPTHKGRDIEAALNGINSFGTGFKAVLQKETGGAIDYEAEIDLLSKLDGSSHRPAYYLAALLVRIGSTTLTLSVGDRVRMAFRSWGKGPSEEYPIHVGTTGSHRYGSTDSGIDPIELLEVLYDEAGVRYNAAAMDALRGRYSRVRFRITGPENLAKWVENNIYRPLQIIPFVNGDGEVAPKALWLPADIDPGALPTFTHASLKPPYPTFDHGLREIVNRVVVRAKTYLGATNGSDRDGMDYVASVDVTPEPKEYPRRAANVPILERTIEVFGVMPGRPVVPVVVDGPPPEPGAIDQFAQALSEEVFDRWGDGPISGECRLMPSADVADGGDYIILDLDSYPDPAHGDYGVSRLVQVLESSETLDGERQMRFLDAGPDNQPLDPPTISVALTAGNGEHSIDVTIADVPTGAHAQVQYARSETEPADDSPLWRPLSDSELGNEVFVLDERPSGKRHYFRGRSRAEGRIRSLWSTPVSVVTTALSAPSGLSATVVGNSIELTWTNTESGYGIMPTRDGVNVLTSLLPFGSTAFVFEENPSGLQAFGVKYVDAYGGESPVASVNATPAATLTLDEPAEARVRQGRDSTGTGLVPRPQDVIAYGLEVVWRPHPAARTRWQMSSDSGFASVEQEWLAEPGIGEMILDRPMDNTLRYVRARHERTGFTESDWGSTLSAYLTPIALIDARPRDELASGWASLRIDETGRVWLDVGSDDPESTRAFYGVSTTGFPTVTTADSASELADWPESIDTGLVLTRGETAFATVRFYGPFAGLGTAVTDSETAPVDLSGQPVVVTATFDRTALILTVSCDADTRSVKVERTDGGGIASIEADGSFIDFDMGALGMTTADRWIVDIIARNDPTADVDLTTLTSTLPRKLTGSAWTAGSVPQFLAGDAGVDLSEPAIGDDVVTLSLEADDNDAAYELLVYEQHRWDAEGWSVAVDITATVSPAATGDAPPITTPVDYDFATGVERKAKGTAGSAAYYQRLTAEIMETASGDVKDSRSVERSWFAIPS